MAYAQLLERIRRRRARVGVIGLGYVGLPLVQTFCRAGYDCLGFDVDDRKINMLNQGKSYIKHISAQTIREMLSTGRFQASSRAADLRRCHALLICVPTPLADASEPDMTYVKGTAETISSILKRDQLVVLESTTYPGTTREVVMPILERSGLKAGSDFYLAYSPEREDPGREDYTTSKIPKVVGGINPKSKKLACELYGNVVCEVVPVSSCEVAEACKILENVYRSVNIALVNEMKTLFDKMGIDIWEVISAAATKPFGFQAFYPGPGLGGHCIPIDPFYLTWKARQHNLVTRFIELAGEINRAMPLYVLRRTADALNERRKSIKGSKILVLGLAYKSDVDDVRESPAIELIELLRQRGAEVDYNDPHVPRTHKQRKHDLKLSSKKLSAAMLRSYDCVLIATAHKAYDMDFVARHAKLIVDTRNATAGVNSQYRKKIVKA